MELQNLGRLTSNFLPRSITFTDSDAQARALHWSLCQWRICGVDMYVMLFMDLYTAGQVESVAYIIQLHLLRIYHVRSLIGEHFQAPSTISWNLLKDTQ